ncbi:hypothetical protein KO317_00320 [Candidatus Micrarchaeota archaeon]|nr:hypothetical protein [Candidatus Micrarchaeota archaeon]
MLAILLFLLDCTETIHPVHITNDNQTDEQTQLNNQTNSVISQSTKNSLEKIEAFLKLDEGLEYKAQYSIYTNKTTLLTNSTFYQKGNKYYLNINPIFKSEEGINENYSGGHLFQLINETYICEEKVNTNLTCYVPPQPIFYQTILLVGDPALLLEDEINKKGIERVFSKDDNYSFYQETHAGIMSNCFHADVDPGQYGSSNMFKFCFAPNGVVTYFARKSINEVLLSQELISVSYSVSDNIFNLPVEPTEYTQPNS